LEAIQNEDTFVNCSDAKSVHAERINEAARVQQQALLEFQSAADKRMLTQCWNHNNGMLQTTVFTFGIKVRSAPVTVIV
jgi:hypothetical protein